MSKQKILNSEQLERSLTPSKKFSLIKDVNPLKKQKPHISDKIMLVSVCSNNKLLD